MLIFITKTGVVCEVDVTQQAVRYLVGPNKLEPRPGAQGLWKKYKSITPPVPDRPVTIDWEMAKDDYACSFKTLTSDVKEILADPSVATGTTPLRMSRGAPDTILLKPTRVVSVTEKKDSPAT
jgi:hypothetical protein